MTCQSCPAFFTIASECRWNASAAIPVSVNGQPGLIGGWPKVVPHLGWCMNHPERQELLRLQRENARSAAEMVHGATQPVPEQAS